MHKDDRNCRRIALEVLEKEGGLYLFSQPIRAQEPKLAFGLNDPGFSHFNINTNLLVAKINYPLPIPPLPSNETKWLELLVVMESLFSGTSS